MRETKPYSVLASLMLCAVALTGLLLITLLRNPSLAVASTPGDKAPDDTAQSGQVSYAPECDPDWQVVPSPNATTSDNYLNGVDGIASNDVWAVGRYGNGPDKTLVEH